MEKIANQLIVSRKLLQESDYDFYVKIIDSIHNSGVVPPFSEYFNGFDDESQSESIIMTFKETLFWFTVNSGEIKLQKIIDDVCTNVNLFIPHAVICYGNIINYLLYNYEETCEIMESTISTLSSDNRRLIAETLKSNNKNWFIYDEEERVKKEYQNIIDYCNQTNCDT